MTDKPFRPLAVMRQLLDAIKADSAAAGTGAITAGEEIRKLAPQLEELQKRIRDSRGSTPNPPV